MLTGAQQKNEELRNIITRAKIDPLYTYRADDLIESKIRFMAANCQAVLDVGKSSRHRYSYFQSGQIKTLYINRYDDYPDIVDDLCDLHHVAPESFDGIICMAVLEHVYDPQQAVKNLYSLLKPGGYCLAYVPFLYRYHAPHDLYYQDYFRYTRDGIAYLFRDFSEVTLYPCRGRYSTMFNLMDFWKYRVEKIFRQALNKTIDRIGGLLPKSYPPELQASGYHIWTVK